MSMKTFVSGCCHFRRTLGILRLRVTMFKTKCESGTYPSRSWGSGEPAVVPDRGGVTRYPDFHLHLPPRQVSVGVAKCEDIALSPTPGLLTAEWARFGGNR